MTESVANDLSEVQPYIIGGCFVKDIELRLISELMKNSQRSDRALSKVLGISQPTVSRMKQKLERKGIIREYTIIPDFSKLGYQLAAITLVKRKEAPSKEELIEMRKKATELEKENRNAVLMAVSGMGFGKDVLFMNFYEDYSAYAKAMSLLGEIPYVKSHEKETFLVDLNDQSHHTLLSMSEIAKHVLTMKKSKP